MKKKYSINNSYFKQIFNADLPMKIVDIQKYLNEHKELPFSGIDPQEEWAYEAMNQKQKRSGVQFSQFLTPTKTADKLAQLAEKYFEDKSKIVLDACIGTGQLAKQLLKKGFEVVGFDICNEMFNYCKEIGLNVDRCDFTEYKNKHEYIVSNPPYENLPNFFKFLNENLTEDGVAILILPNNTFQKTTPKNFIQSRDIFQLIETFNMEEKFVHTGVNGAIFVLKR